MSKLYCPFRCEFTEPNYGANGNELWVPTCPECDAPLQTISQLTKRALDSAPVWRKMEGGEMGEFEWSDITEEPPSQ